MTNMATAWKLVRPNWRAIWMYSHLLFDQALHQTLCRCAICILFDCLRVVYGKRCISRMME
jgi:hypothetical protein